jgi:hypothetical protein
VTTTVNPTFSSKQVDEVHSPWSRRPYADAMNPPQSQASTSESPTVDRDDDDAPANGAETKPPRHTTHHVLLVERLQSKTVITEQGDTEKQIQSSQSSQSENFNRRSGCDSDITSPDSELIDFDGLDDPYSPYNWSRSTKWIHGGLLSVMSFVT